MTFQECVEVILAYEGNYIYNLNDPGGETKFGISKRAYPDLDIRSITKEEAIEIYRRDYWDQIEGDSLPDYIRLMAFDCAVNQGVARACLYLQRSAGAKPDGIMGPETIRLLFECESNVLIKRMAENRHAQYIKSPGWKFFGAGWSKRLLDVVIITFAYVDMYP